MSNLDYTKAILTPISDMLVFLYKRIPNFNEVITTAGINSALELALGEYVHHFGENPTAKNIIRDFIKMPSSLILTFEQNRVGGTKYVYDGGNVIGAFSKIFCKALIQGGYVWTYPIVLTDPNDHSFSTVARASNYICEIPSRVSILAGHHRQDNNMTDMSTFQYMHNNFELSWVLEAIPEALFKTFITDILGEKMIKPLHLNSAQRVAANGAHNALVDHLTHKVNSHTDPKASIWNHLIANHNAVKDSESNDLLTKAKVAVFTIFADYGFKLLTEIGTAYPMMFPARIAQDVVGKIIEYVQAFKDSWFDQNLEQNESTENITFLLNDEPEKNICINSSSCLEGMYLVCPVGEQYYDVNEL